MIVKLQSSHDITPEDMAQTLALATPREFKSVWFAFAKIIEKEDISLIPIAQEMAPQSGSYCQKALRELMRLIEFYSMQEQMNEDHTNEYRK